MSRILRTLLTPGSRFGVLFASLLLMSFLPFVLPRTISAVATPALFTVVLLSSLSAVADSPRHVRFGALLAVPGCVLIILASLTDAERITILAETVGLAFLVYVAVHILAFVMRARQVDLGIVLGAVCVYLLFALMWGMAYDMLEHLRPGSFAFPVAADAGDTRNALQYFSFVTITTLGYGDVQPVAPLARMISTLEAVIGQLYLVVLVARLVGMYTATEAAKK